MTIYIDENLPRHLAQGFQILQFPEGFKTGYPVEVKYIPDVFSEGVKDPEWLPQLKAEQACVITQDVNIHRRKHEMELYREAELGMYFLKGKSKKQGISIWEMVQAFAKHWEEICRIAHTEQKPFAYEFSLWRGMKKL